MLNSDQISFLFRFCQEQGVVYYDLQVELVSDLGSAIEQGLKENPDWNFQKALNKVLVSMGYGKFGSLIKRKHKTARRYCWRLFWPILWGQFRWPHILLVFTAILSSSWLLVKHGEAFFLTASLGVLISVIFLIYLGQYRWKRLEEKSGKKFILGDMTWIGTLFPIYPVLIMFITAHFQYNRLNNAGILYPLTLSILMCVYFMMGLAYYQTVIHLKGKLQNEYPEIFNVQ